MAQQLIVNTPINSGLGDNPKLAFDKVNANFTELYGATSISVTQAPYSADPTGVLDSTAAIQAALNAGSKSVFVPPGNYKYSSLVMPTTFGFVFYGVGTASVLTQTGSGITWPSTGTNPCGYYEGYIRDLTFVATGTANGHTINTAFAGGVTLINLYFGNMPVGAFDSIHVQGNPASTGDKYSHDVRIINLQIYTNTAGRAGIYYDTYAADTSFTDFVMNGNFLASYCIYSNGAQSINGSNSHPYNATINIMNVATAAVISSGLTFTNVIFDNSSGGDNVVLNNCTTPIFTGCWWEVTNTGKNSLTLTNVRGACITGCRFDAPNAGALYCVNETGTTDYTQIISGDSPSIVNFNNPPVNFIGLHSTVKNFVAYNPFGAQEFFTGETVGTVAAGTTTYLGVNGAQAAEQSTGFMIPLNPGMNVARADIAFTLAPGAAQSYTLTLRSSGVALVAAAGSANPAVISGTGTFTASIVIAQGAGAFAGQFNYLDIQLVTSAGAAASSFRYVIAATG